ncbi:type IV secretory system conjugative DNA transfer family protein [Paenibacillus alginolyticus]|uniref:VirD4-like conjugal transfer protein, CD1115 family n=1 Tax=Paenibacillus alginolyticus TaxID=59839 RepID=UPI000407B0AD|nr:type IV secretory system conjugative DNA transfer family protein [Paenibacillus alginolyticus]MCY9667585.1 type IV secretory system conjugative DNA transfer family protein [Paenibacillus alginolyticus]
MRRAETARSNLLLFAVFFIPVVWAALLAAPALSKGLPALLLYLSEAINHPFQIQWVEDTPRSLLLFTLTYGISVGIYLASPRNYRRREEHGSARWGKARRINAKYHYKQPEQNKILTQQVRIGLDGRKHRRNLNVLVVGGSGSGKTRFYAKPNVMQAHTSFVVLDPKGEILRDTGHLLKSEGYVIKVLDLINPHRSHGYNPFAYLQDDKDVLKLVTNLIRNTTPKGSNTNDPFWERSETALLEALVLYLLYEAPPEEQNFPMVMEMIAAAEVREEDETYQSPLDELFERLAMRDPEHLAVKQYNIFKLAAGKTAKSILIGLGVRLEKFNLHTIAGMSMVDEMELPVMGEKKTALFAVIPDNDSSFNFIVGMLYTQLFQCLMYEADYQHGGRLPIHVHFVMDEFANVALPDEFDKLLSTMRSREISVSIILQNLAQLKALYKDSWESIVGNCDEFLYLGGNEQSTHKYVSELLGKETIDTNTYGQSKGRNGNYSINYQQSGRELLTPDEVRLLDNRYALLFIRGERPVQDDKYDLFRHPHVSLTTDGNGLPYQHGGTEHALDWQSLLLHENGDYELLSEEEMESLFLGRE